MFVLGSLREILGNGTLFDGADALLGSWAKVLRIEVFHTDTPFLLAMLPPGAFIGLGMMLAIKYLIDENVSAARLSAACRKDTRESLMNKESALRSSPVFGTQTRTRRLS